MPTGCSESCSMKYGKPGYFDNCTDNTCTCGGGYIVDDADAMNTLALTLLCSQSDG